MLDQLYHVAIWIPIPCHRAPRLGAGAVQDGDTRLNEACVHRLKVFDVEPNVRA